MGATELLRRGVVDRKRALLGWSLGIAAYIALLAAVFPSIEDSENIDELVEDYPEALKDLLGFGDVLLSTGSGYMDTEIFNLMLPLLVLVLAIGSGSRTVAGEEEAGRLELPLSFPLRRRDAVLAKGLALALELALVTAVAFAAFALADPLVGLDLDVERLAGGVLGVAILGLLHGWLAIAVGAARPGRALAIAVSAGIAAVGYLVNGLHELASWLDPFRFVSSFWWLGQSPLSTGVRYDGYFVLGLASIVVLVAAALLIERRDLQVP